MPNCKGVRARTRDKFSRPFGEHGMPAPATYLRVFKIGDYVDIVANGAIQKGMPHKYYHGRTGRVWNVTPRAIGVVVTKQVGNRIIKKRLHVRTEHVRQSRCHETHLNRVRENDLIKMEAKSNNGAVRSLKREPALPKGGKVVRMKGRAPETVHALPYELIF